MKRHSVFITLKCIEPSKSKVAFTTISFDLIVIEKANVGRSVMSIGLIVHLRMKNTQNTQLKSCNVALRHLRLRLKANYMERLTWNVVFLHIPMGKISLISFLKKAFNFFFFIAVFNRRAKEQRMNLNMRMIYHQALLQLTLLKVGGHEI